ncbi:MAG: hypothetical protein WAT39_19385 [Planctomycetota bacterium]
MPHAARRHIALLFAVSAGGVAGPTLAQVADWHRVPTTAPAASQLLAFDDRRSRMVRVDGSGWNPQFATWEWIGTAWSQRHPATTPPPRSNFALAYDPVRQRIVLFGGQVLWNTTSPGALLDDTWEYDGIDWTPQSPVQRPPAQGRGQLVFDFANNKLLLCGGLNPSASAGAWHYDGAVWSQLATAPFSVVPVASDPIRQRLVAYYGIGAVGFTYEWNGSSWQQLSPPQSPSPHRFAVGLTWHAQRQRVVLHGGAASPWPGDLWEWDGITWSVVGPAPQRIEHSLCHDPVTNRLFAVGGRSPTNLGIDTLQWDGTTWSSSSPGVGWEDCTGAWFDGNRQRVVAVSVYPNALLEWTGARWERGTWPNLMTYPQGGFDPLRGRAVLVGGDPTGVVTQEWDGTTWFPLLTTTLPCRARPVFHPGRGRVVVSCGAGGLWEWDGIVWTQIAPGPGAPWTSVADGEAVFDLARNELVLVTWQGGATVTARWNGTTWTVGTFANGPPPRAGHGLDYDGATQRVVLFGGADAAASWSHFDDLWQWDGTAWTQRVLAHAPTPREGHGLVFDPLRQQLLVIGGFRTFPPTAYAPAADVIALDSNAPLALANLGPGCSGTAGVPRLLFGAPRPGAEVFAAELHWTQAATPTLFGFSFGSGAIALGAGCTQYLAGQDQLMLALGNAAGIATVTTSIPLTLQGFTFAGQGAVLDATNALGVSLTDGWSITVGR